MRLKNLGFLFSEQRAIKNLTQEQVAEMAQIDGKHYGRIEREECENIKLYTFINICFALELKPDEIIRKILTST